ncbi:HDEL receptor [Saccharomyces cerevisiae synthetic construct]|nr:HDEL receptor [Saccharomyces cerevisiae synthetic construct]WNV71845.1 ERD2 [Saccharomyces cerevisiae synthetic construct]
MNPFRILGDLSHLTSILILIHNIKTTRYIEGISFKTQTLYALVFITRYLDLLTFHWVSLYNALMKIFFIVSTAYIVVLLQGSKRTNTIAYNEMLMHDTFKIQHLLIGSALMSVFFHHKFTFLELAWSFSVWLESVAILPQLYMLSKGEKTRSLTVHYIFAMGLYRALYIPNWIWRYSTEDKKLDKIAFFAGLLQTLLYSDFFYIYYTKVIRGKGFKLPK